MKSDLITIFNRLTSSELVDYNLFNEILDNHYEKFKYLYSLIKDIDLETIDEITCKVKKHSLKVTINPQNNSNLNSIIESITNNKNDYTFSDSFILNLQESENYLLIEISIKYNKKEVELYESRFV